MFSLESPHRGLMGTHNIPFSIQTQKNPTLYYPKSAALRFFPQETQERVENSRGKRVISVRAIEILLYLVYDPYQIWVEYERRKTICICSLEPHSLEGLFLFSGEFLFCFCNVLQAFLHGKCYEFCMRVTATYLR